MANEGSGLEYRRGELRTGGRAMQEWSDPLSALRSVFEDGAKATPSCFGLVPQGSDELALSYREFYANVLSWMHSLRQNVQVAGLTLVTSERNYNAADHPF